ncbi:MAG: S8 family serine peptidase [Clostridiales bacterium]
MINNIKTAIIDDGLNQSIIGINNLNPNIEINKNLEVKILKKNNSNVFTPSHGDICALILKKYSPNITLGNINILNHFSCTADKLCTAIIWCTNNNIKLLNLSLGSTFFKDRKKIKKAVNYAHRKGVIIIAAYSNDNNFTYPASLPNVIGVKCSKNNELNNNDLVYVNNGIDGIDVITSGRHLIKFPDKTSYTFPSNSYAAPVVTSLVYNLLIKMPNLSLDKIKKNLLNYSKNLYINDYENLDKLNVPLIFLVGDFSSLFLHRFINLFHLEGYNAISIIISSKGKESKKILLPHHKYVVDNKIINENFLNLVNKIFIPDIVFVKLNFKEFIKNIFFINSLSTDMIIFQNSKNFNINNLKIKISKNIRTNFIANNIDYKSAYMNIIKYFT